MHYVCKHIFLFLLFAKSIQNVSYHDYAHPYVYQNIKHRLVAVRWYISAHCGSALFVFRRIGNFFYIVIENCK